uniref:Uncharacterized protein n=1 Tax=Oryza meridionalis TaxID=40149 RepID=A0A0E0EQE1_9ORYZ
MPRSRSPPRRPPIKGKPRAPISPHRRHHHCHLSLFSLSLVSLCAAALSRRASPPSAAVAVVGPPGFAAALPAAGRLYRASPPRRDAVPDRADQAAGGGRGLPLPVADSRDRASLPPFKYEDEDVNLTAEEYLQEQAEYENF